MAGGILRFGGRLLGFGGSEVGGALFGGTARTVITAAGAGALGGMSLQQILNVSDTSRQDTAAKLAPVAAAARTGCQDHRGRWQAQGISRGVNTEQSAPWELCNPLPKPLGNQLLTYLWASMPSTQAAIRGDAFIQASKWVKTIPSSGVGPMKKSFYGSLSPTAIPFNAPRVDCEVQAGIAFTG